MQPANQNYITRLQDLPLTDFIACCVHNNYAILQTNQATDDNPEELQLAWLTLLSQYYTLKQDTEALQYATLIADMERITIRSQMISLLVFRLQQVGYNDALVQALTAYTGYKDIAFTPETIDTGIEKLLLKEKRYRTEYDGMKRELEHISARGGKANEKDFYKTIMAYNRTFKTMHHVHDLNAYEYALLCEELEIQGR